MKKKNKNINKNKVVPININRKLISHKIIGQIRDKAQSDGMLSGNVLIQVIDDMDSLRFLCEGLITAYENNDEQKTRDVLEVIRMIL